MHPIDHYEIIRKGQEELLTRLDLVPRRSAPATERRLVNAANQHARTVQENTDHVPACPDAWDVALDHTMRQRASRRAT